VGGSLEQSESKGLPRRERRPSFPGQVECGYWPRSHSEHSGSHGKRIIEEKFDKWYKTNRQRKGRRETIMLWEDLFAVG